MGTENDLPGISLKDEQRQLQNIIGIAQDNLDRAKESKSLIEIQTEKLILRIEKKNGAIQYFDADRNLLVSENATEPRLLNNGECYTFFDWDKSEKLKSKGILATDLTDLTNKARYISFGGRQQRLPLVVSNKGYGIATASSRTALFCNIKMYGQYIFIDGDTQSDYYFIGAGSVEIGRAHV